MFCAPEQRDKIHGRGTCHQVHWRNQFTQVNKIFNVHEQTSHKIHDKLIQTEDVMTTKTIRRLLNVVKFVFFNVLKMGPLTVK